MEYKNVVFDVGDVLIDFRYRDMMRDLGFSEDCVEFLSVNMVETEFWHELDLGVKTNADGLEKFTKEFPQYKDEIIKFWNNLEMIVKEYDYAPNLIKSIKNCGYKVYILSNYPVETTELHWPTFKFLEYTDGRIISGYEKITKPDAAIYKLLETRFRIKLEECIFIDDMQVNIDAACNLGMKGILFKNYNQLISDLNNLGINI